MTLSRWQNKAYDMAIHSNRFFSSRDLSKPSSMVISDHNFFKWINSRHMIFRRYNIRFPSLVFLLRKYFPILQHVSPRNITIFPTNRDCYLNQHYFFNINLPSHTPIEITKDRVEKGSSGFHSIFIHSDFHISKHRSHPELVIQPWLKMSRNSPFEIMPPFSNPPHADQDKTHIPGKDVPSIGHKTVNLRSVPFYRSRDPSSDIDFTDRPAQSPLTTAPTFPNPPHADPDKTGMPLIGHKTVNLRSVPFYRSRDPSSDIDFTGRSAEIGMDGHDHVTATGKTRAQSPLTTASRFPNPHHADQDKTHIPGTGMPLIRYNSPDKGGMTQHHVSDSSIPILYYHNPSKAALDDLQKSVAGIEKTVAERESFIEKYVSDNSFTSHGESDIANKMNINMSHLTDQVYQMLGRKIEIERERRGLYG
jgi:hypothetical protein